MGVSTKFAKDKPRQLMTRFEKWLYVLKFGELYRSSPENLPAEMKALNVDREIIKKVTGIDIDSIDT